MVVFVTDDKSAFRNNSEYLQKEFCEATGKTIEIRPNAYYKELLKPPEEPEPVPAKMADVLPDIDAFREEVESAVEGLRMVEYEGYFGDPQWAKTFTSSMQFDVEYVKVIFGGLHRDITKHIFEKTVPASKILDLDGRIIDGDVEIPMKSLERALEIYQSVLKKYPQYSDQFFEAAAKFLNRNYEAPPAFLLDLAEVEEELPF